MTTVSKLLSAVCLASALSTAAPSRAAADSDFASMVQALLGMFSGHAFGMQVSLLAQSSHGGGKGTDPAPAPAPAPVP